MDKILLICLPFAGGNKYSYRPFEDFVPSFVELICLEYPGRGRRLGEKLLTNIHDVVNDLYDQINRIVKGRKFAIYGHSLGGLVGYLLCRRIIENKNNSPIHLFITGTAGPSAKSRGREKKYLMDRIAFIEEIRKLKGIQDEVLQNEDLLNLILPILRADFEVSENYIFEERQSLHLPITVITGNSEDLDEEDIFCWQKETNSLVDFKNMPGDHFFIFKYPREVIETIAKRMYKL